MLENRYRNAYIICSGTTHQRTNCLPRDGAYMLVLLSMLCRLHFWLRQNKNNALVRELPEPHELV